MAACHFIIKQHIAIWMSVLILASTTIAEEPTEHKPTEPGPPNFSPYQTSSMSSTSVTTSTKSTSTASSVPMAIHRTSTYQTSSISMNSVSASTKSTSTASSVPVAIHSTSTPTVIFKNSIHTSPQYPQTTSTFNDYKSVKTFSSSSLSIDVQNTALSSSNSAPGNSFATIPTTSAVSFSHSSVSSVTSGLGNATNVNEGTTKALPLSTSLVVQNVRSSSLMKTEGIFPMTGSSTSITSTKISSLSVCVSCLTSKALPLSTSYVFQKATYNSLLKTEGIFPMPGSSTIVPNMTSNTPGLITSTTTPSWSVCVNCLTTKSLPFNTSFVLQKATSSSLMQTEGVFPTAGSSTILSNKTSTAPDLIIPTTISSSPVCISCMKTSISLGAVPNTTVFGVSPSPSLSRTLGVANETSFATRTLPSHTSSINTQSSANSSSFLTTSNILKVINMSSTLSRIVLNQTGVVLVTPSGSINTFSVSKFMVQTSNVSSSKGVVSTVYSKVLNSTASSSSMPRTSSVVLSTPTAPPTHAPTAPPQDVKAFNKSSTSIFVSWLPPPSGTLNGVLTKYQVWIKRVTQPTATPSSTYGSSKFIAVDTISTSGTSLSPSASVIYAPPTELQFQSESIEALNDAGLNLNITLKNLRRFTLYEVRVRAVTFRPGPYSLPLNVRTDEDVPSACHNISLSGQNSTSVMVHWTRPSQINGVLLGYKIYYGTNISGLLTKNVASNVEAYSLDGLAPFTKYTINVTAYTRIGEGQAVSIHFKTLEAPPSSIRSLVRMAINSTAVKISWVKPEHPNGQIEYVVLQGKYSKDEAVTPVQIYQGPETECVAVGLKPVTRYTFSVYVQNVKHKWHSSNVDVSVHTLPSEPTGPPLDVQPIPKSSSSILVQWKPPSPPLRNGMIKSYVVEYSKDKKTYQTKATMDNSTALLLTSLSPYTFYYVKVRAVNIAGGGPFSENVKNRTSEDAPSPPTNFMARSVNATCVLVTWKEPEYLNGAMVRYKLYYRLTSLTANNDSRAYDVGSTMHLVCGLHEFFNYTFTLFAYNVKYGFKSSSVVAMETTHPAAPSGPPQNTQAITLSSRSILIQWNPPKVLDMNGLITGYTVNMPNETRLVRHLNGSSYKTVFTSLHPYTVYFFTVRALNKVGEGPTSIPVSNRTFEEVPDAPIIDQVTNLSSEVDYLLQVSWLPPTNRNGVLTAFKLCWDPFGPAIKTCNETESTTRTFNIMGLAPFTLYNITLAASTSEGFGPITSGVYRTMEGVPSKPRNLQAWNTSASSIFVTWTTPAKINGELTSYKVSYSHSSLSPDYNSSGLSIHITLRGLVPFTLYVICVQAATSRGYGSKACESVSTGEGVPGSILHFDAQTVSAYSSLQLKWSAPRPPNGHVGYTLYYFSTFNPQFNYTRRFPDGRLQYFVRGLEPYTNYTFLISAFNLKKGLKGPVRRLSVTTKATHPSGPPLNIRLVGSTIETLTISWDPPAKPNGPIKNYFLMVYDVKTPEDKDSRPVTGTIYTIESLRPWHRYSVKILCVSTGGMGPFSVEMTFRTLPSAPPVVPSIEPPHKDGITANEITIKLQEASDSNGKIHFYQIIVQELATDDPKKPQKNPDNYKPSELVTYEEAKRRKPELVPYITAQFAAKDFHVYKEFKVGDAKNYSVGARMRRDASGQYYNGPLEPKTFYSMFQRAFISKDMYRSTSWTEPVSTAESKATVAPRQTGPSTNTGLVVGLCVTFLIIIIIIIIVFTILWKRRRFEFSEILDDEGDYSGRSLKLKKIRSSKRSTSSRGLMGSTDSLDNIDEINRRRQPIPVEEFAKHVRRMHTDGDIGFSEEYELVQPNDEEFTWHHSLHPANKYKNRYANIIAYDHSRVLLTPVEGVPGSDYINANYIDGYNRSGAYIASQGPLPETFDDFWRMIWEQGTATIVMLTQLEERGRRKCDQYWPDRGTKNYGAVRVTASETSHMSYYILRTFILSHKQEEEEPRQVKQYHFTSWPDHGVPTHPVPLLSLVRTVSNANPTAAGPTVVHCSAGVGRTGTFITLDAMLQKIEKEQTIDVFEFVKQMRTKRNIMVQTEAQYVFIYDALNEAVSCGVTEFEAKKFSNRLRELREVDPNTGRTYMEREFLRLVKDERHHSTFKNANLGINSSKNRYANILPYEKTRVHLKMRTGEVGSDYINASYIDGYCRLSAFIATQAPVPNTFEDFWRMIWEQGSSVIVMLTREEEAGKLKCHRYWPSDGTRIFGNVLVELTEEASYPDYFMRQFSLTHTEEKEARTVRQYQYTDWPDVGLPESGVGIIDLIGQVEKWQQQSSNSVVTVHCSGGVGRTGVFCAVTILIERVKAEGVIDVFQTVQSLRLQRPAMVQTMEQYEFCYSTLQEYLDSFDLYANFQ